jgi:hypothetical protein
MPDLAMAVFDRMNRAAAAAPNSLSFSAPGPSLRSEDLATPSFMFSLNWRGAGGARSLFFELLPDDGTIAWRLYLAHRQDENGQLDPLTASILDAEGLIYRLVTEAPLGEAYGVRTGARPEDLPR